MSKSHPVEPCIESTHSASFCTKNHQNLFINRIITQITVFYLGITLTLTVTDRHTDILTMFWATSAQLQLQFPKISGSKAKLQLYLYRTRFGTGPEGRLRTKSDLARFQKFRIISTPRSGVPVLVFASSKTHAGRNKNPS